jgi:hypothetical protein
MHLKANRTNRRSILRAAGKQVTKSRRTRFTKRRIQSVKYQRRLISYFEWISESLPAHDNLHEGRQLAIEYHQWAN